MDLKFATIISDVDGKLAGVWEGAAGGVISTITGTASILVAIYICFWGWSMMRGMIDEPVTDGVNRIVRMAVVVGLATSLSLFSSFAGTWLWAAPDFLANAVFGSVSGGTGAFLDEIFSKFVKGYAAFEVASKLGIGYATLGIPDLFLLLGGILLLVAGFLLTIYAAFVVVLAKISLSAVLGLGPLFILAVLFEPTKKFLDSWIGQVLTFVFTITLLSAFLQIIGTLVSASVDDLVAATNPTFLDALPGLGYAAIGFLALMQISSFASALGGGAAVGTLGAFGALLGKLKGTAVGSVKLTSNAAVGARNLATGRTYEGLVAKRRERSMTQMRNDTYLKNRGAGGATLREKAADIASKPVRRWKSGENTVSKG